MFSTVMLGEVKLSGFFFHSANIGQNDHSNGEYIYTTVLSDTITHSHMTVHNNYGLIE